MTLPVAQEDLEGSPELTGKERAWRIIYFLMAVIMILCVVMFTLVFWVSLQLDECNTMLINYQSDPLANLPMENHSASPERSASPGPDPSNSGVHIQLPASYSTIPQTS